MRTKRKSMLAIAVLLLFAVIAPAAHAATFTVNSTADTAGLQANCTSGTGECTLRSAIQAANDSVGVADVIILPAGTFVLTGAAGEDLAATGDLDIGVGGVPSTITITGQGAALTIIDGNNTDRVFETLANGSSLTLGLMTIRDGNSLTLDGGCVKVGGSTTLVLNDAVVTACTAGDGGGGIDNSGTLTMTDVAVTGNTSPGGGINGGAASTTTWTNGELSGNSDRGMNNGGTLTMTNVTISGNTTAGNGAGIDNDGTLTLQNVTLSNNTSTTALNIGGLRNRAPGTVTVANTIISGNLPANCGGTITSGGNNIDNGTTCGFVAGDSNTDPLLVALTNNGGALQTHALQPASPAIDTGSPTGCPATDAREIARPVDGDSNGAAVCDKGAFEFRPRAVAVTPASPLAFGTVTSGTSADQTITIANNGDGGLLMETIGAADALAAPFTITANTCNNATLARAASCALTVRFTPVATAAATDTFSITSNDPLTPTILFTVTGAGTANVVPSISVADSVDPAGDHTVPFGSVAVNATSDATITIANGGAAALAIGAVAGADALAPPFVITSDTCSNQSIAPTQTCALTIRFAPTTNTLSSDTFDIPNNDPDTPTITISVSGSGVSAAGNNPPSAPVLIAPTNGQTGLGTTVDFSWTKATDPDGDAVTHRFQNCTDPGFSAAACAPVDVAAAPGLTYAGLGGLGAGIILIGFVAGSGFKRSKKALALMITIILLGSFLMSCRSSSGGGNGAPPEGQYSVSGLAPNTTYYWKVVADDGKGGASSSEIWSYTTQ